MKDGGANQPTFRERVEGQPIFWLLSALVTGFLAGVGTYKGIIEIAQLEVTSRAELVGLRQSVEQCSDHTSTWSGWWATDTETYRNLRVRVTESNGEVTGFYRVPNQSQQMEQGRFEGHISGNSIIGVWREHFNGKELGGDIHFKLSADGRSFQGDYTREWERGRMRHVWTGRKLE